MPDKIVPYSPLPFRPVLHWPDGARVALMIVPNIEHYEYLPAIVRGRDPWPRSPHPDVLGYSRADYGNRVGLWRLFEVLDEFGLRATVSLNLAVIEHFPLILAEMKKRRWELVSHGIYNTRYHWGLSRDEERACMEECKAIHLRLTGRRLRGWFSPAFTNTLDTFELAAETGYDYVFDLPHDDQPVPLRVSKGALLSLPYSLDLNDGSFFARGQEGAAFEQMIKDQFDVLYEEGREQGRVLCIALHPFLIGQPHRIGHLRRALSYILGHSGVWAATAGEIADWYNAGPCQQMAHHLDTRMATYG